MPGDVLDTKPPAALLDRLAAAQRRQAEAIEAVKAGAEATATAARRLEASTVTVTKLAAELLTITRPEPPPLRAGAAPPNPTWPRGMRTGKSGGGNG